MLPLANFISMDLPRILGRHLGWVVAAAVLAGCGRDGRPPRTTPTEKAPPVQYYLRVPDPAADAFEITVTAEKVGGDSLDFVVPVWVPGRYASRGYGPVVTNFSARDGRNRPVPTRRITQGVWRLYIEDADYVATSYRVAPPAPRADEPLAFRPRIDLVGAYALGANVFGYFEGHERRPASVSFDLPARWRAAVPLRPGGPNRLAAASFSDLAATPIVLGSRWKEYKLFVQGRPHAVTIQGGGERFTPDSLLALVDEAIDFGTRFWGRPLYQRYLFAFTFVPPHVAGHSAAGQANGSVYFLPELHGGHLREAGVGSLLLHHYFHAWYPGAFGPRELQRPDFRFPPVVEDAWFIEGTAEYYAQLLPVRYGAADRSRFYEAMGRLMTWWHHLGGDNRIELATLTGGTRPGAESEAVTRRLVGGTLVAFLLDLSIREESNGQRGLDQLMYFLQKGTAETGYRPEEVWIRAADWLDVPLAALNVLAMGSSLSIDAVLRTAGLRIVERETRRRTLGARLLPDREGRFVVDRIQPGGTAESAGLRSGDRLLQIDETPIAPDEVVATRYALSTSVEEARSGSSITFEIERDGRRLQLSGRVRESRVAQFELVEIPEADRSALLLRSSLFRATQPVPGP